MEETPWELGLPKKFKFWRDGQAEAIDSIVQSGKQVYLLDAPTGTGKTVIGVGAYAKVGLIQATIDKMAGREDRYRCIYITRTKQLQDQILAEFPMARTVKGRSNYFCLERPNEFPEFTAADCNNQSCQGCPYKIAKSAALSSPLAVLNDSYFLSETNGPGSFSGATLLIIDEVDSLESALMGFIQFTVSQRQIKRLQLTPPQNPGSFDVWLPWADKAKITVAEGIEILSRQLEGSHPSEWSDIEVEMQKQVARLTSFLNKLNLFTKEVNDSWVFDFIRPADWQVIFKPVQVGEYAGRYLWQHGERVLGMSGTIFEPQLLANELGLEDWDYSRMESPFPVENRPIYFKPVANLTRKHMDQELPKLGIEVKSLLDRYCDSRILVHTVSYRIRDYLMGNLPQHRLITHSTEDRDKKLETFRNSRDPLVMISPSFDRGVDLPQEACRCVIICKVPFMDLSDKQVSKRMISPGGQRWYNVRAAQSVVQMSGRAVRSPTDYCDTFILDKQFGAFRVRVRDILPQWWQAAIKNVKVDEEVELNELLSME